MKPHPGALWRLFPAVCSIWESSHLHWNVIMLKSKLLGIFSSVILNHLGAELMRTIVNAWAHTHTKCPQKLQKSKKQDCSLSQNHMNSLLIINQSGDMQSYWVEYLHIITLNALIEQKEGLGPSLGGVVASFREAWKGRGSSPTIWVLMERGTYSKTGTVSCGSHPFQGGECLRHMGLNI